MTPDVALLIERLSGLEIDSAEWHAVASAIAELYQPTVTRAAERGIEHLPGTDRGSDLDDAIQVANIRLWKILHQIGDGRSFPAALLAFDKNFQARVHGDLRDWAASSDVTALGAFTGTARRRRELFGRREKMAIGKQVSPTPEEVVAAHNDHATKDRDGGRRHDAPASVEDFSAGEMSRDVDFDSVPAGGSVEDVVLARDASARARQILDTVVATARSIDPVLGQVARIWLSSGEVGTPEPASKIARRLRLPATTVRSAIAQIRTLVALEATGAAESPDVAIALTIAAARRIDTLAGAVAGAWLDGWPHAIQPSAEEIARDLHRPVDKVRRALETVTSLLGHYSVVDAL